MTKFDCYKEDTKEIIEVKGCSVTPDLTSWSPKPFFDFFCFVDFSTLDGKYKIYKINITSEELKNLKVNKNGETIAEGKKTTQTVTLSPGQRVVNKDTGEVIASADAEAKFQNFFRR